MYSKTNTLKQQCYKHAEIIGEAFRSLFESPDKKDFYRWKNYLAS
jgi:hypothetical protein